MRILFSATPAAGHVLPLVPLASAAGDAGHDVAFLTGPDMAGYLGSRELGGCTRSASCRWPGCCPR